MRIIAIVSFALVALTSTQASALSCGTRLVTRGDSAAYVQSVCGEPNMMRTRTETRSRTVIGAYPGPGQIDPNGGGGTAPGVIIGDQVSITVVIETWTYDFGPDRFIEELVFEDGILVRLTARGYGTVEGRRRRRELRHKTFGKL